MERKLTAILSADVTGYSRLMGEDEEAISAYERALTRNPNYLLTHLDLACIYSELGREVEARAAAEVRRLSPDFSLEALRQVLPPTDQAGVERYLAALRKAGLK